MRFYREFAVPTYVARRSRQLTSPIAECRLCLFLGDAKARDGGNAGGGAVEPPQESSNLLETYAWTDELAGHMEPPVELDRKLGRYILDWCEHKDLRRIALWIEPALLGTFVKAVMRVVSYLEVVKEVLLGLEMHELHNRLDNHHDKLLAGLVTNVSLYLAMADEQPDQD